MLRPVRLVCHAALGMASRGHGAHGHRIALVVSAGTQVGASHPLVRVRSLLNRNLLLLAPAAAAACADKPEETGGEGEGDGEPNNGQHLCPHAGVDIHGFEDRVEGACQGGVDACAGGGGGESEN